MKRFTLFVCLFLLLLLVPVGVSANGYLFINSTPPSAGITIDGGYVGPTPDNHSYSTGSHTVELRLSGYTDYLTNVTVVDNSTVTINHIFQNTAPDISSISPTNGYNTSTLPDVTVSGTSFSTGAGSVVLTKTGETNITGIITGRNATAINCNLPLTGKTAGTWNVVVINADGQTSTKTNGFTVKSQSSTPTLTSITPSSGETNTTVSITNLAGTNFADTAYIRLKRSSYNDIVGSVTSVTSTKIVGTFDLDDQAPGNYDVCVYNDASTYVCDLTFTITDPYAGTNSSIYFETNPTGAAVYLNKTKVGTSVFTYYNATPGTFNVNLQKTGYRDYSGSVTVISGKRTSFYARLTPLGEDTTVATTAATATPVKTATTIKKSTLKVPTTWPSVAPTEASPVDPMIVIGAAGIGIGLVALRRR
jgi:hypothetical protein